MKILTADDALASILETLAHQYPGGREMANRAAEIIGVYRGACPTWPEEESAATKLLTTIETMLIDEAAVSETAIYRDICECVVRMIEAHHETSRHAIGDFVAALAARRASPAAAPDLVLDLWDYIQNVPEIEDGAGFNSLRQRVQRHLIRSARPRHQILAADVYGCFAHKHSCRHGSISPATNAEYWQRNRERKRGNGFEHILEFFAKTDGESWQFGSAGREIRAVGSALEVTTPSAPTCSEL